MRTYLLLLPVLAGLILPGCSSGRKIGALRSGQVSASLSLPREQSALPEVDTAELQRDTMTVTDLNGREVTIMNAVKDENGEMVATDVLKAATVTARFRNVAERHGKVELCFQVIVPEAMQDSRWQLRFYPMMFLLGDSTALANVIITGKDYRQEQLRGYQHYERFLKSIIDDPDHFIRHHQLEVFIRRNIPQLYRFRRDSSFVSEEEFRSSYGVSGEQAIRHYTRMMSLRWNNRKISRKDLVFKKRVKVPIQTEGLRLDTVIQQPNGDFIYDYVQEITVRPKLKKVDITLEGEIYEQIGTLSVVEESSTKKGKHGIKTHSHPVVSHTSFGIPEEKDDTLQYYTMLTSANGKVLDDLLLEDCTPVCLSKVRSLNFLRFNALYFRLTRNHYEDFYLEDFIISDKRPD